MSAPSSAENNRLPSGNCKLTPEELQQMSAETVAATQKVDAWIVLFDDTGSYIPHLPMKPMTRAMLLEDMILFEEIMPPATVRDAFAKMLDGAKELADNRPTEAEESAQGLSGCEWDEEVIELLKEVFQGLMKMEKATSGSDAE